MFEQLQAREHAHVVLRGTNLVWVALLPFLVRIHVAQVVNLSIVQVASKEGMRYEIKGFGQCWIGWAGRMSFFHGETGVTAVSLQSSRAYVLVDVWLQRDCKH